MSLAEEPERLNAVKSKMSGDDLLVIEAPLESHGIPLDQDSSDAELSFYFALCGPSACRLIRAGSA